METMMRLLKRTENGEVILTEHPDGSTFPPYAILSHTWGSEEVLYDDIKTKQGKSKIGWEKIRFCAEQARKDAYEYFWIDTCCINKANLTEFSEAINSMYRWYHEAARCYVYLSDVSSRKRTYEDHTQPTWDGSPMQRTWESSFRGSRWFRRGWTLQELLAPRSVEFFSKEGQLLGNKTSLASLIYTITNLPETALDSNVSLSSFGIQERLSWTARRTTTRPEDRAYCLLGIFGVFMNPIYGERDNAWIRLKDAIQKKHGDQLDSAVEPHSSDVFATQASSGTSAGPKPRDRYEELLNFLGFEQMESRRATIKPAYSTTCAWLLRTRLYMDWLDPDQAGKHSGFLWIKGKPGAGKSTLVKYVHAQAIKSPQNSEILISYYFNARGGKLEKSTIGMYRSLLYQLLEQANDLVRIIFDILGPTFPDPSFAWTIEQLRELLTVAVRNLGSRRLKGFIDALDECDEEEIRDMIAHFEQLGQIATRGRFHICLASRHYPLIEISTGLQVTLEDEHGHAADLNQYVQSHLKIGKGKSLNKVKDQIQTKANGVFLWAVLVIDILNKEFLRGRVYAVQKRLEQIPEKLGDLFREILFRDRESTDELLLCIRWILFAGRPLDQKEFYYAMQAGSMPDSLTEWDPEYVCEDDMARFVINSSKGLAELTKTGKSNGPRGTPKVQFIHESVRDYLIKDHGLYDLWPDLSSDFECSSHRQLSECCQRYLTIDLTSFRSSAESVPATRSGRKDLRQSLLDKFPFLHYAVQQVFYHANEAARAMTDRRVEDDFFNNFDLKHWINVTNLMEVIKTNWHTDAAPLLYVLAEFGCDRLIKRVLNTVPPLWSSGHEKFHHPVFAEISNKHWSTLEVLLKVSGHPRVNEAVEKLRTTQKFSPGRQTNPLLWALHNGHELLAEILIGCDCVDVNETDSVRRSALYIAAQGGYAGVVKLLLLDNRWTASAFPTRYFNGALYAASSRGYVDVMKLLLSAADVPISEIQEAFVDAAKNGHCEALELLLTTGRANVDLANEFRDTALHAAARNGHKETVEVLLTIGKANVDLTNRYGDTALYEAAGNGRKEMVEVLLTIGKANANRTNMSGDTALHVATNRGSKKTIETLLTIGNANVDLANGDGDTALHVAARLGLEETAEVLLTTGNAKVNHTNRHGDTALHVAARWGRERTVEVLLTVGKANPCLTNTAGQTALTFVKASEWLLEDTKTAIMQLLTEAQSNWNHKS